MTEPTRPTEPTDFYRLAVELERAKEDLNKAQKVVLDAERRLIDLLGDKDVGSETHREGDLKVVISGKQAVSFNKDDWEKYNHGLSSSARECVEFRPKILMQKFNKLKESEPDEYRKLDCLLDVKQNKTAVTFERTNAK